MWLSMSHAQSNRTTKNSLAKVLIVLRVANSAIAPGSGQYLQPLSQQRSHTLAPSCKQQWVWPSEHCSSFSPLRSAPPNCPCWLPEPELTSPRSQPHWGLVHGIILFPSQAFYTLLGLYFCFISPYYIFGVQILAEAWTHGAISTQANFLMGQVYMNH